MRGSRPRSRASAATRRAFEQASPRPVDDVWGDGEIVTVEYSPPAGIDPLDDEMHQSFMGYSVTVLAALEDAEAGLAPDQIRGVCHLEDHPPVVWLLRREWAVAYDEGALDLGSLLARIAETSPVFSQQAEDS